MKELSIEEKAKAYDEAIEELRGLLEGVHEEKCEIMEEDIIKIFPELKESEDERMRKSIHIYLDWLDGRKDYAPKGEYSIMDMIAWLEKQGEQKPAEKKELKKDEKEIEISFGAYDSELQEDTYFIPKGFHVEINDDKVVIKKGEKPNVWSEEDENIRQWIISDIDKLLALRKKSFVIADKEINWLKSLKNRVGCEANCITTWKPSDEQINALAKNVEYVDVSCTQPILKGLLEDLKKLREE